MRIAYAVHGYGRGHATRSGAVIPALCRNHTVKIYTGGDATSTLSDIRLAHNLLDMPIEEIPVLTFVYEDGKLSLLKTVRENYSLVKNIKLGGKLLRSVKRSLEKFNPDVVISDSEPLVLEAARQLGIPTIMFDHFSVLLHSKLELSFRDELERKVLASSYNVIMGPTDKALVCSFYGEDGWSKAHSPDLQYVGPVLSPEVFEHEPTDEGHVLVYINRENRELSRLIRSLNWCSRRVKFYPAEENYVKDNIKYCKASRSGFLKDLASCSVVVSSAGNQLVGECCYYGKPLVVMPEPVLEQRLNAINIERMGIGMATSLDKIAPEMIEFAATKIKVEGTNYGKGEEIAHTLEEWAEELVGEANERRRS